MSTDGTTTGARASRLIGGSAAVLVCLAILAFVLVAGTVLWMFGIALPGHQSKIDDQALASARGFADRSQDRLKSAAADGKLADNEITKVIGSMWTIERSTDRWAVTTRYPAGSKDVCFRFDVALPLGPDTGVTHAELSVCPLIRPHSDAS